MSSSLSPTDLRHITSSSNLASPRERKVSNRNSQHLRTHRVGSRSPASIPSSPTSVHSSSSAIFERDIEPITPAALSPTADPHRVSRGRYTEQLEQSVPSVLDSAAAILAAPDSQYDDFDAVSIITPAPPDSGYRSGLASPSSRLSSRSPSPTGISPGRRTSLLFSTSPTYTTSPLQQGSLSSRPIIQTQAQSSAPIAPLPTVPATPTSAYYSAAASVMPSEANSEASSPTTATHHAHPLHSLPTSPAPTSPAAPQPTTITIPAPLVSHPPSPKAAAKRLSFLSYMDLLSSTPSATVPLSSVLTNEPPHLPSVIGLPQALYAASSSAGSVHAASVMERDTASQIVDDVGGEWEREGLGRGLEERLEALNASTPPVMPVVSGRA
ncbi:uncharacterized protein C8Q71DRAFT_714639 [Rhodofomes roseus]|uniref:Uncharacterized protein n=1 Tax=Rhodofomes roseus TaxID=34475 RepID=A0ABQ8K549_9APHY|nr:uncharacterized protein C8Q71DRAFT_714639 [Rhodofomes roseus]KAH9832090.1 hypothetical protein C8Q71DRAFT_714639 [Rhodofomes roseus]